VRRAIAEAQPIILCEGGKKARQLQALGFTATTNDGGAEGFTAEHARCLGGASEVVVVVDNDSPGRNRGQRIPPKLYSVGVRSVRVLLIAGLAEGEGVDDWLDQRKRDGRTPEEIKAELELLLGNAPHWKPTAPAAACQELGQQSVSKPPGVRITRLSTVTPRVLSWLWRHRIPRGMVTVLAGQGGLGKSTLLLDLAARVTTGRAMPDGDPGGGSPGSVAIFTSEDALDCVVVPRLMLAGADLNRITTMAVPSGQDEERPLLIEPEDLARLESVVRDEGAQLVIFDPLVAYVDERTNMHHAQDARRILARLHRLAEQRGIAIVGVHHWNKSQSPDPGMRLSGSAAIEQAARSVLVVGPDPRDSSGERRILALAKRNLAPMDTPSLAYSLALDSGAEHPRVEWLGQSPVSARDLAAPPLSGEERSALDEAVGFFQERLSAGPAKASDVAREACSAGHSERTLERARQRLGIRATRKGGPAGDGWWEWSLRPAPESLAALEGKPMESGQDTNAANENGVGNSTVRASSHRDAEARGRALASLWGLQQ
jgi:hypothetical protein